MQNFLDLDQQFAPLRLSVAFSVFSSESTLKSSGLLIDVFVAQAQSTQDEKYADDSSSRESESAYDREWAEFEQMRGK